MTSKTEQFYIQHIAELEAELKQRDERITTLEKQVAKLVKAIRFVVIDRYITQGTRSESGRLWSERIWTVLATCGSQSRNAFDFIYQSIQAHFSDQPFPSLLGP